MEKISVFQMLRVDIEFVDKSNINKIELPNSEASDYLTAVLDHSPNRFINNVPKTTCFGLIIDRRLVLPCTVNHHVDDASCYVVSLYAQVLK